MLTGDLNIIQVEWVVQYRINDPVKYLYGMREPTKTLRDLSESVMRRIVGNRIGSDVLTVGRIEIANAARDEIQDAMDRYDNGIKVITVQLQDVVPPLARAARVQRGQRGAPGARADGQRRDAAGERGDPEGRGHREAHGRRRPKATRPSA